MSAHRGGLLSRGRFLILLDQFLERILDLLRHVHHILQILAPIGQICIPESGGEIAVVVRRKLSELVSPFSRFPQAVGDRVRPVS